MLRIIIIEAISLIVIGASAVNLILWAELAKAWGLL
jgi:hypothetical protein